MMLKLDVHRQERHFAASYRPDSADGVYRLLRNWTELDNEIYAVNVSVDVENAIHRLFREGVMSYVEFFVLTMVGIHGYDTSAISKSLRADNRTIDLRFYDGCEKVSKYLSGGGSIAVKDSSVIKVIPFILGFVLSNIVLHSLTERGKIVITTIAVMVVGVYIITHLSH